MSDFSRKISLIKTNHILTYKHHVHQSKPSKSNSVVHEHTIVHIFPTPPIYLSRDTPPYTRLSPPLPSIFPSQSHLYLFLVLSHITSSHTNTSTPQHHCPSHMHQVHLTYSKFLHRGDIISLSAAYSYQIVYEPQPTTLPQPPTIRMSNTLSTSRILIYNITTSPPCVLY